MHTTRLCTSGVFSTTTMWSPSGRRSRVPRWRRCRLDSSRALYSGSVHARATTLAPFIGPRLSSKCATICVDRVDVEHSLLDEHRFDGCDARLDGCELFGMVMVGHHASWRYRSNRSMCTTSPSCPPRPTARGREAHRIQGIGDRTAAVRLDIGDVRGLVDPHDGPALALDVARRTGVARGMPLAHPHRVADREPRGGPGDEVGGQHAAVGPRQREMPAGAAIELLRRRHARLDHERRDTGEPVLVVRRREVVRGIHPLDRMPKHAAGAASDPIAPIIIRKVRRSQSSANNGSLSACSTGPKPSSPPRSWTPSISGSYEFRP